MSESIKEPVIALVGAPNVGKSTLFNGLTGAKVSVGNWPGTTVEVTTGTWHFELVDGVMVDFPGAYSLRSQGRHDSMAEQFHHPDVVLVVADAAHLARSLYLVSELRETPSRVVVALTMTDIAEHRGLKIDIPGLSEALGVPVVGVDPRRRRGLDRLSEVLTTTLTSDPPPPRTPIEGIDESEDERFAWIAQALDRGTSHPDTHRQHTSDKIDRIVLAPFLGPVIFLAVMWLVFQITTTVAAPLQNLLGSFFAGPVSQGAQWLLELMGLAGTWVEGLIISGLIAGVGMLLTFVPLMTLMFILLAILEDSGYLARAAVLTDRVMGTLGLPGQAFLPLVVGFGCNVPAIAATRVLSTKRHRLLTVLLIPYTACSARLTVFVMLGTVFFGNWAGTAVFVMYLVSILLVILGGLVLRSTLVRTMGREPLVIDLPAYQVPTLRLTWSVTWVRLKGFLQNAGGIIVVAVILIWAIQAIPMDGSAFGHVDVENSLYAWMARTVAPMFNPAGFGSWETVAALVVGFVAKEAVISSWGQTYGIANLDDISILGDHIRTAFEISSGGHTMAAVAAFMVYLLAYTPCVATLAAQRREVGWKWTGVGMALQLAVATAMAIAVFQLGRLFL